MQEIEIGKRIRDLRESNNMSQETLGKFCDVDKATVSRIETGKSRANYEFLKKAGKAFKTPIYMITGDAVGASNLGKVAFEIAKSIENYWSMPSQEYCLRIVKILEADIIIGSKNEEQNADKFLRSRY